MFLGSPQRAKLTSGGSFDRSSARTATASFPRCGVFYVLGKPAHILSAAAPVLRVVHEGRWISLGYKLGVAALYLAVPLRLQLLKLTLDPQRLAEWGLGLPQGFQDRLSGSAAPAAVLHGKCAHPRSRIDRARAAADGGQSLPLRRPCRSAQRGPVAPSGS
jgi:hypothetical protein